MAERYAFKKLTPNNTGYITLCTALTVLMLLGNLVYQKIIAIPVGSYALHISAGILLFPFTFLLTDLTTELYGQEHALCGLRCSVGVCAATAGLLALINWLPSAHNTLIDDITFHKAFGAFGWVFCASLVAYFCSQRLDILMFAWLKRAAAQHGLGTRSLLSTYMAILVDTTIMNSLMAAFRVIPANRWLALTLHHCAYKMLGYWLTFPLLYAGHALLTHRIHRSPNRHFKRGTLN